MSRMPRCSEAAQCRSDPRFASAPPARQWLLVEHPGAWGREILSGSAVEPGVARALGRWSEQAGGRVLLIRRHGAGRATGPDRRWFRVDSRLGREQVRWGRFRQQTELLDVLGDPRAGRPGPEPIYLVCTHGKRDVCCAMYGRPVASALAAAHPERTWECSHVGGDRFAANLVLLPHGLYYGQVLPAAAGEIVTAYEHGRLALHWLRGRCALPAPVQAAQHFVRVATGEAGVDSYPPLCCDPTGPNVWTVRLAGGDGRPVVVRLRSRTRTTEEPLTCGGTGPAQFRSFDLVSIQEPVADGVLQRSLDRPGR